MRRVLPLLRCAEFQRRTSYTAGLLERLADALGSSEPERAWDRGWDTRDEGTRETDEEAMYHYSRLSNPYAEPSRWDTKP